MFGVFKRIPDVSGIKSPGNGVFVSLLIAYYLLFIFFFVGVLGVTTTYLFNPFVWGDTYEGQKNFSLFYMVVSYLPFKYAFIMIFYWHILDHSTEFQPRIIRSANYECVIFVVSSAFLLFIMSRGWMQIVIATFLICNILYGGFVFRTYQSNNFVKIHAIILINSLVSLVLLFLIMPFID